MIVADTSVAVAAALPWHELNAVARARLAPAKLTLLAPVAVETYSVLTRLPASNRITPEVAWNYLGTTFALPPIALSADGYDRLLALAATARIAGGAIFDALVGATAREAGATLLSLDRRAAPTYRLLGVDFELLD